MRSQTTAPGLSMPSFRAGAAAPSRTATRSRSTCVGASSARREVEEREQHVGVLLQGSDRLGVLGPVLGSEPLRRVACLLAGLGVHTLAKRGLHARLEPLRDLSRMLPSLWNQSRCSRVFGHTSRTAAQKPSAPSPTATTGARIPRRFRSRSTVFQLSALSRQPS